MKKTAAAVMLAVVLGSGAVTASAATPHTAQVHRAGTKHVVKVGKAGSVVVKVSKKKVTRVKAQPSSGFKVVRARKVGATGVNVAFRSKSAVVEYTGSLSGRSLTKRVSRRGLPDMVAFGTDPVTVDASPAGSVTVQAVDGALTLVSADPTEGFTMTKQRIRRFEADFEFRSDSLKVELELDVDGGVLLSRVEIESEDEEGDSSTPVEDGDISYDVAAAGSLTLNVSGEELTLVSTAPADGWTAGDDIKDDSDEVRVLFTDGTSEVKFEARLRDGEIRIEVEAESVENDDEGDDVGDDDGTDENDDDSSSDDGGDDGGIDG